MGRKLNFTFLILLPSLFIMFPNPNQLTQWRELVNDDYTTKMNFIVWYNTVLQKFDKSNALTVKLKYLVDTMDSIS